MTATQQALLSARPAAALHALIAAASTLSVEPSACSLPITVVESEARDDGPYQSCCSNEGLPMTEGPVVVSLNPEACSQGRNSTGSSQRSSLNANPGRPSSRLEQQL